MQEQINKINEIIKDIIIINSPENNNVSLLKQQLFKILVCKDCKKNSNETIFKRQKKRCHDCYTNIKKEYYKTDWKNKYYKYESTGQKRGRPKKLINIEIQT